MPNKRKKNRVLSDQEIQAIVDNNFEISSDDSDNDEEENALADEFLSESSESEYEPSESESDSSSDDNENDIANVIITDDDDENDSVTNSTNGNGAAPAVNLNGNIPNPNGNIPNPNGNIPNPNGGAGVGIDLNDWHTLNLRPTLLKFVGAENVNIANIQPEPKTPLDFFKLLFDDVMTENIINYTNDKAAKLIHNKPQARRSPLRNFKAISRQEFNKFIGLCILMGNIHMPSLKHYWKTKNSLYKHPIFGRTMARNRFQIILRALRFYDTDTPVTKKEKIDYIITNCVKNFQTYYSPGKHLSIDEALLGFKGRLSYKQYIPLKRSRFGIKLYELSTSGGYILNVILYTGKGTVNDEGGNGQSFQIVMKLLKNYFGKGHAVYMDNFYNSIPLAEKLMKRGTQVTGTLRSNRKGIPDMVKKAVLKRGESTFARKKSLLIQRWHDKKDVMMISTRHNAKFVEVPQKFGQPNKLKPSAVAEYNKYMGGIDKADQLTSYYTTPRKTIRWQLKVFFHFIDLCLWNALQLYNSGKSKKEQLTYLDFRDSVIDDLLGDVQPSIPAQISGQHFPKKVEKRLRCRYCSIQNKRTASFYVCETCNDKGKPVALCLKSNCFKKFHDEKLYRTL